MGETRRDLNAYLFYELGFDGEHDESEVREDWPFVLVVAGNPGGVPVYEIEVDGERHFVTENPTAVFPAAGMSLDHLELVWAGMAWIRTRDPIGLETSAIGYDDVPPGIERRRACEALADGAPSGKGCISAARASTSC